MYTDVVGIKQRGHIAKVEKNIKNWGTPESNLKLD